MVWVLNRNGNHGRFEGKYTRIFTRNNFFLLRMAATAKPGNEKQPSPRFTVCTCDKPTINAIDYISIAERKKKKQLKDRWQWKRDVSKKKLEFRRYKPTDLCTARYEHKSSKKKFQTFRKTRKKSFLGRSWAKIGLRKTQPNVNSKRRDSESSTDIGRQNQRLLHEIWTGRPR